MNGELTHSPTTCFVDDLVSDIQSLAESVAAKTEIPMDGLSDTAQQLVRYFSEVSGTCTNFAVMNMLTALGGAAGLRLKSIDGDYVNYGQLYTCLYGDMSVGKSPSFKPVMAPFESRNSLLISQWNEQMKSCRQSKNSSGQTPKNKQFMLNGATPESLDQVHDSNRNGVFIFYDELQDFFDNINSYNKGNITGKLNSAYINGPIIVNRKSSDYIINIQTSFYSILGSLQPLVVKQYFGKHLNGLFQRFCYVLPNAEPSQRCERDENLVKTWDRIAWAVLDMPTFEIRFDQQAKAFLSKWQSEMKEEVMDLKDVNPFLASAYQKTSFFIRRIALIVHLISKGTDITNQYMLYPEITLAEVEYAKRIVDVLREGTKTVLMDIKGESDGFDDISMERLIWLVDKKFGIENKAKLAEAIGRERSWVSMAINKYSKKK